MSSRKGGFKLDDKGMSEMVVDINPFLTMNVNMVYFLEPIWFKTI